jgi:hypothetical protein
MNKKDKQKMVTRRFMEAISDTYGLVIDEYGMEGEINYTINVMDSNDEGYMFSYHRSYKTVETWKMKGEADYDTAFDLECEMQQILHKIINQVDEIC